MSTATLTGADQVFIGRGSNTLMVNAWGRKGVPVHLPTRAVLGTPALAVANKLIKAATGAELPDAAGSVVYTAGDGVASPLDGGATVTTLNGVAVWDIRNGALYGRNLVAVVTATAVVAMDILIAGYDYLGAPMSALFAVPATGSSQTVTGTKAFSFVKSVTITVGADATGNTLNLGQGKALGVPFALASAGDVLRASINGVTEHVGIASNAAVVAAVTTAATAETGDVRGTIAYNAALDGAKECVIWYFVAGHASGSGVAGVAQA